MLGEMSCFSKFVSKVMNLKFYTKLPPRISYQEKWKFCIWDNLHSLLRATELSQSPRKLLSEQRKNLPMSRPAHARHHCAMLILLFFWRLLTHFKNIFISPVWEVNNCIAWIKGMVGNCNKFKILINLLWKKDVEKLAHPCAFKAEKPTSLCVCLCVRKYIPHSYCFDLTSWY